MIGKKIKNPNPRSSKAERIKKLTGYIREPESKNGKGTKEKCVYSGARGFVCDDPKLQQTEMISLAMAATRSADTINHYVLSWREGECPSEAQVEEAVTIFMTACELEGHMVVYGLHSDTDNFHLHLAINRVNPETEKAVRINNGFDIEAAHRAVARIVKAQGWKPEENALFFVDDKGVLVDTRGRDRKNREQKPSSRAQDYEQRTGEKSAERIGIETLPEVLKASSHWDEFHTKMSEHGMKYEKKGSGAIIWVGEQAIKASAADRNASLSKLEKRFGAFTESKAVQKLPPPSPQALREEFSVNYRWEDYAKERREYFAEKKSARIKLNNHIETEDKAMRGRQKVERDTVYGNGDWKGKGVYLNAIRSVVAAKHAGEKVELKERNKELRGELSRRFVPFPDFESWMRERGDEKGAELWRHRHESKASAFSPEPWATPPLKVNVDIRAFRHRVDSERGRVDYFRENAKKPSFTDFGRSIEIADWRDESVTLAALQLSAQKWAKGFYVSGNDEYKGMCVKLAVEHGLKILNPELQENLEKTRTQRQQAQRIERKRLADEAEAAARQKKLEEAQAKQEAELKVQELEREQQKRVEPVSLKSYEIGVSTLDMWTRFILDDMQREQKGLEKFQTAQSLDKKIKRKQESVEELKKQEGGVLKRLLLTYEIVADRKKEEKELAELLKEREKLGDAPVIKPQFKTYTPKEARRLSEEKYPGYAENVRLYEAQQRAQDEEKAASEAAEKKRIAEQERAMEEAKRRKKMEIIIEAKERLGDVKIVDADTWEDYDGKIIVKNERYAVQQTKERVVCHELRKNPSLKSFSVDDNVAISYDGLGRGTTERFDAEKHDRERGFGR